MENQKVPFFAKNKTIVVKTHIKAGAMEQQAKMKEQYKKEA